MGTLTLIHSTLSGNRANSMTFGLGGAIFSGSQSTLTIVSSTLTGNSASSDGGAIYNGGTATVTSSTVSGNSAHLFGGGVSTGGATFITENSIFAGNTSDASGDVTGFLDSQGYNLIGDGYGSGGFSDTDLVGTLGMPIDPMLGPLQDNGGPSQTMALLPGSPALNAGDPAQLGTADQRGVVRSGGVNIGAFQASATALVLSAPDMVHTGVPFDVTLTAVDPFGQVAVGYNGTVTFSTTDPDPAVVLPADYTFTPDDAGVHTFPGATTLITPGDQMLSVMDTADNTISGSALVTVNSPAPPPGVGAIRPSSPTPIPDRTPARSEPSHPEVAAVDRLLASLDRWDFGLTLPPLLRHARTEMDSWAFASWRTGEPMFT
jgi:hypothetical protein